MSPFKNLQFSTYFPDKTLVIACIDFFKTHEFLTHPNIVMTTRFGNRINMNNPCELDELAFFISVEKIKRIVVLGHYDCKIIEHLDTVGKLQLDENIIFHLAENEADHRRKIWFNVARQIEELNNFELIHTNGIIVKGLVMDDCKQKLVEEVDLTIAFSSL